MIENKEQVEVVPRWLMHDVVAILGLQLRNLAWRNRSCRGLPDGSRGNRTAVSPFLVTEASVLPQHPRFRQMVK